MAETCVRLLGLLALLVMTMAAAAAPDDAALDARVLQITSELRCLVCQNQTIAESNADLAVDLRAQVREMLRRGDDEQRIKAYMTARYGDFVLYRPPLEASTALLWFGPLLMLLAGLGAIVALLVRRRASSDDDDHELPDAPAVPLATVPLARRP